MTYSEAFCAFILRLSTASPIFSLMALLITRGIAAQRESKRMEWTALVVHKSRLLYSGACQLKNDSARVPTQEHYSVNDDGDCYRLALQIRGWTVTHKWRGEQLHWVLQGSGGYAAVSQWGLKMAQHSQPQSLWNDVKLWMWSDWYGFSAAWMGDTSEQAWRGSAA